MTTLSEPTDGPGQSAGPLLRMRDLTRESGLSRQAVHAYIAAGLLPQPVSSGRNAALYSGAHLERLRLIQRLQREHFLSLNAIKAVLGGEALDAFTPEQRDLLRRVRDQIAETGALPVLSVTAAAVNLVDDDDLQDLAAAGLIDLEGGPGDWRVSPDDLAVIECLAAYRRAGATRARGYRAGHLLEMDQAIEQMVERLARLYSGLWQGAPVEEALAFLRAVTPVTERLVPILMRKKIRALIERVAAGDEAPEVAREEPA
ncbi:MAG TPA: MerR family transcriptional regulator [Caulobacteraceae bacterium]|nr:MerR family transcriptional regulator [Caulobacteraceae bacterium]